jgi:hypothetical protein
MVSLKPRTVLDYRIELMITASDGRADLCVQFRTKNGFTPVFAIPIEESDLKVLEEIDMLVHRLSWAMGGTALPDFVDLERMEVETPASLTRSAAE